MSFSYYDMGPKPRTFLAKAWMVLNAIIAVAFAFHWSGLSAYVGEPFRWAMLVAVAPQPTLFEYPFVVLWSTPLLCIMASWFAMKANHVSIARIVGAYPVMILSLMLGWYYLTPPNWQ